MVTFILLCLLITILITMIVITIGLGGAIFILLFGDIVVCLFILAWIFKKIFFNKEE